MKFHSGPRFGLSEEEQITIYGMCIGYKHLAAEYRKIIDNAIRRASGEDGLYITPLFDAVTTRETVPSVAYRTIGTNHPIDPSHLARRVRDVYKILAKALPVWESANADPPQQ